jgi:hypothetical protein
MKLRTKLTTLGVITLWCLLLAKPVIAITVKELQELKVIGHYFTTAISNTKRIIFSKDASKGRYLILKIFTNDLMLSYFHSDDSEDRTQCAAIAMAETAEIGELKQFAIGSNAARITVNSGKVYFCLAFLVETDVKTIEIHRMGIAEFLTYRLGTDRLYSVVIYTNKNAKILSEAVKVIKAGGYNVVQSSETLTKKKRGTTIHYREQAESQAREISQRLMTKLKVIPTLKKMELACDSDIVVWLGK